MVDYIDKNARWQLATIVFALFLALMSVSTYVAVQFVYEWLGILIGGVIILLAIIPHWFGKKNTAAYVLSVCMNAVGTGFAISAYYTVKGIATVIPALVFVSALTAILYGISNVLISVFRRKKLFVGFFGAVSGILLVFSLVFWIIDGNFIYSFGFFNILILLFFLSVTAISLDRPERVLLRDLSFGAFGSFVVATLIVVAILSEGDIVDGLDIADVTKKGKKKSTK